jgi:hypothetical protein
MHPINQALKNMMGYIPSYILAISIYPAEPNPKLALSA